MNYQNYPKYDTIKIYIIPGITSKHLSAGSSTVKRGHEHHRAIKANSAFERLPR